MSGTVINRNKKRKNIENISIPNQFKVIGTVKYFNAPAAASAQAGAASA